MTEHFKQHDPIEPDREALYFPDRESLIPYYKNDYGAFWQDYQGIEHETDRRNLLRHVFQTDLFFLVYYGLSRKDINSYDKPFIVQACKDIEDGPQTDTVDLWARGHFKSSLITEGKSLQDKLNDFRMSIGIFSHTRPISKDFLLPLKVALEGNVYLKFAFPDLIWANVKTEAPVWSMDSGLQLKTESVGNTHCFEAWGLVDGQPAGKHFNLRVYDDVITDKITLTPEAMKKAESQFRLSNNLEVTDGTGRQRIIGTNYDYGDFYQVLTEEADNGVYPWHVRRKPWYEANYTMTPAEVDEIPIDIKQRYLDLFGRLRPVLLSTKHLYEKRVKQSSRIFAAQMELDPSNKDMAEFKREWIKYYRTLPAVRNRYLLIDSANEEKKDSDYTVMALVSICPQKKRYLEHMIRRKIGPGERWKALKDMVQNHGPITGIWYEKYGKDADINYFEEKQMEEGIYFTINPVGGRVRKFDRIRRLSPKFEEGDFLLPEKGIWFAGENLVDTFIDHEYARFPFCSTYDMLDAISRIEDPEVKASAPVMSTVNYSAIRERFASSIATTANI